MRLFISGHSLTDQPFPDHLAAIARSLGTPVDWRRQYLEGSSILTRSADLDAVARDLEGCDALVITEQHSVLGGLIWNDTVRCLRVYHDRFIAANPRGVTYFYEPWLDVSDLDDPRRWIEYERAAAPIWRGVVTRVNLSLEADGRSDRIVSLPAASALAALVERATSPEGLRGLSGGSTRETLRRLFSDDVHLTPLGSYYLALFTYAWIAKRSPLGAWAPSDLHGDLVAALQSFAVKCSEDTSVMTQSWPLDAVRRHILDTFNAQYWSYVRDVYFRQDRNVLTAWFKAARHQLEWQRIFSRTDARNPLSDGAQ